MNPLNEIVPQLTFNLTRSLELSEKDENLFRFDQTFVELPENFTDSISDWIMKPYVKL